MHQIILNCQTRETKFSQFVKEINHFYAIIFTDMRSDPIGNSIKTFVD